MTMPVTRVQLGKTITEAERFADLRQRLVQEWNGDITAEPRPDIREEEDPQGRVVHLYVVWEDWRDVDELRRSEIVVEAFKEHYGTDKVLDVTVAMGLTPDQAERIGMK